MSLWVEAEPQELRPNASEADLQEIIRAVYKQVLGNAHVMESERLTSAESYLRNGEITVKGFVRAVALSSLYRSLFFETASSYRFVELNFKHLLGRAPLDQAEVSEHVQCYNANGYEAEINSYIDSDEYGNTFGENVVPHYRSNQTQPGLKNVTFNRTFALARGFAANDAGKKAKLTSDLGANLATAIKAPVAGGAYNNRSKRFKVTVSSSGASARLNHLSKQSYVVEYSQLSQKMQSIFKSGSKVVNVVEIG